MTQEKSGYMFLVAIVGHVVAEGRMWSPWVEFGQPVIHVSHRL